MNETVDGLDAYEQRKQIERAEDHLHRCRRGMDAAARRLGKDPDAFARECEDGMMIFAALDNMATKHKTWKRDLARIKRAESGK